MAACVASVAAYQHLKQQLQYNTAKHGGLQLCCQQLQCLLAAAAAAAAAATAAAPAAAATAAHLEGLPAAFRPPYAEDERHAHVWWYRTYICQIVLGDMHLQEGEKPGAIDRVSCLRAT
jgi:hypothetical protein